MTIDFTVQPPEDGQRLSVFLRVRGVSLSVVRSLKYLPGGLCVNGAPARTSHTLCTGDAVALLLEEEEGYSALPQAVPLSFVYQSRDALVVDKPAGMATHPGPSHHGGTLANAVCGYHAGRGRAGIFRPVGRLDTGTSGLALCAGHAASAHLLAGTAEKMYLALVRGKLPTTAGLINAPLGPKPGSATRQWVSEAGRPSVTEYHVLAVGGTASLVAALPKTGRTHQIRAHFAHLGHPLFGDALYGGPMELLPRHALHCAALRFCELCGNRPVLWCPPPPDMRAAMAHFGLHAAPNAVLPLLLQL